jgi:hypothetical protein
MRLGSAAAVAVTCLCLSASTVASADFSRYREFELRSSLTAVVAITKTAERDRKTISTRPALLQQFDWRPRYMPGPPVSGRESIDQIAFSFVDDQLFKMVVVYARDRTAGLTNEDMVASLTAMYGAPALSGRRAPRVGTQALDTSEIIGEWQHADTSVVLQRSAYSESYSLVILSLSLDATARKALADAAILDERDAPEREAARLKKQLDDERAAQELRRTTNKKVFQP